MFSSPVTAIASKILDNGDSGPLIMEPHVLSRWPLVELEHDLLARDQRAADGSGPKCLKAPVVRHTTRPFESLAQTLNRHTRPVPLHQVHGHLGLLLQDP